MLNFKLGYKIYSLGLIFVFVSRLKDKEERFVFEKERIFSFFLLFFFSFHLGT